MKFLPIRLRDWLRRSWPEKAPGPIVAASIDKIDDNATASAAASQSAEDADARRTGSSAEQGGQG